MYLVCVFFQDLFLLHIIGVCWIGARLCSCLLKVWAVLIYVMHLYVYYFVTLVQDMCAAHVLLLLQWYRMCAAHVLPFVQWYRLCVLHTCYLWYSGTGCVFCTCVSSEYCFCVLVFVKSVNGAYFKYIRDQVRRRPLTKDDKGLDKVEEG